MHFYPRSPCGERHILDDISGATGHFYPRSPCGERHIRSIRQGTASNFYPRSPCGERQNARPDTRRLCAISIHALLAESDWSNRPVTMHTWRFLSTLSLRRATPSTTRRLTNIIISIHALLAESDCAASITPTASRNFYPRSPCGERPRTQSASLSA